MKKLIALLLSLVMVFALASVGAPLASADEELTPVTLVAYCPGSGVPYNTLVKFSELVAEASNGAITLEVHDSGTLGNDAEAIESTRMGTIDVILAGTSGFTSFYEPAKILDLPFLFGSADQACEVVTTLEPCQVSVLHQSGGYCLELYPLVASIGQRHQSSLCGRLLSHW